MKNKFYCLVLLVVCISLHGNQPSNERSSVVTPQSFAVNFLRALGGVQVNANIPVRVQPFNGMQDCADLLDQSYPTGPAGDFWRFNFSDPIAVANMQKNIREVFLNNLWSVKDEIWVAMKPTVYKYAVYTVVSAAVLYALHTYVTYHVRKRATEKGMLNALKQDAQDKKDRRKKNKKR